MLPFALVLLLATSAFAQITAVLNSGRLVSRTYFSSRTVKDIKGHSSLEPPGTRPAPLRLERTLIDFAFEIVDGGDTNIYVLSIGQILNDLANQNDASSQALAASQTVAALGELATGIPGDACEAANVANAVASGNPETIQQAVGSFVGRLQISIDLIAQLAINPNAVRYSTGPRSNCASAGRSYQFEAAWDSVLNAANSYTLPLVNKEYYAAKRLYNAFNSRSNNVAAAVTAASVPQVVDVVQRALTPTANFLRAVATDENPAQAAAVAKSALAQAASS